MDEALLRAETARHHYEQRGDLLRMGDCLRWISRFNYPPNGHRIAGDLHATAAVKGAVRAAAGGGELAMALSNCQSQLAVLADRVEECLSAGQAAIDLAEVLGRRDVI